MEYVIVHFPRKRHVLVDGIDRDDLTNETFEIDAGPHTIALSPSHDTIPHEVDIDVYDTTELDPLEVTFKLRV